MGVRSALAGTLTRAAKAIGPEVVPPAMEQAAQGPSQMGPDHPFSPGEPVRPYDGFSRTPRSFDFTTGYNIATRPRTHERVSFDTLKGLIDAYDVASICIWHRIDSIRSLDWQLVAADGFSGDVTDAITLGMQILEKPDHENDFGTWFAKWAYDILAFDAGALYRMRNRAGQVVGLAPVDGTMIAPLLDYWGNRPAAPAEAYVQYANGVPWNWLTQDDLVYEPFRPRTNSPYGHAPLESIILNANTDIRFQVYFLQRFTEGNIPEAFASAPESWSPDQIEQFQSFWDSIMYGDQARKHQIHWMPGGSGITWSNEKDFSDVFSLHMMRKSCAAYHVVPTDIGFTDSANYSTGESQADVGHRVGDLPFGRSVERIVTRYLRRDRGLPVKFQFDWGEEQDDRLQQAQADQLYIDRAVVSSSEIRQMRYGLAEPEGRPIPRVFFTTRAGPIPLNSLMGVAGPIDPQTAAPDPGAELPHTAFETVPGVMPSPPLDEMPLAEREYGPKALLPAPAPQPGLVKKEAAPAGATAGVTSGIGVYGYDGPGPDDDEDDEDPVQAVAKEMAAFRRFGKARRKAGAWRDFQFSAVDAQTAGRLNAQGREAVAKAAVRPKAADWPGWKLDQKTTAYWSALATAEASGVITAAVAAQIAAAYLAQHPQQQGSGPGKQQRNDAAEAWLLAWLAAAGLGFGFGAIAAGLVTDGWLIGAASAAALLAGESAAQTGGWQPGQTQTAQQRIEELGASAALGAVAGILAERVAQAIAGAFTGALARILAGADGDADARDLAGQLRGAVTDPGTPGAAVGDGVIGTAGTSTIDYCGTRDVQYALWLTDPASNVCPVCAGNEAAGRVPMGQSFPSGDDSPPAHPNCRCMVVPG